MEKCILCQKKNIVKEDELLCSECDKITFYYFPNIPIILEEEKYMSKEFQIGVGKYLINYNWNRPSFAEYFYPYLKHDEELIKELDEIVQKIRNKIKDRQLND